MIKAMTILSLVFATSSMALAASNLSVNQDDAISNLALESAASVCSQTDLASFMDSASGTFTATISSKSFPSGLKSVSIVLESATKRLAVVKPYVLLSPAPNASPMCNLSSKDLSGVN